MQPYNGLRGYFGIGIYNPQKEVNVGTLWRSAYCFGALFIFTIGRPIGQQPSDTINTWRHIPYLNYPDFEDFRSHLPHDCVLVGCEVTEQAEPLETFNHPQRAVYLLGTEGTGIPESILSRCHTTIKIDTRLCLNVAVAGSIVLYDRRAKGLRIAMERGRGDAFFLQKDDAMETVCRVIQYFCGLLGHDETIKTYAVEMVTGQVRFYWCVTCRRCRHKWYIGLEET